MNIMRQHTRGKPSTNYYSIQKARRNLWINNSVVIMYSYTHINAKKRHRNMWHILYQENQKICHTADTGRCRDDDGIKQLATTWPHRL